MIVTPLWFLFLLLEPWQEQIGWIVGLAVTVIGLIQAGAAAYLKLYLSKEMTTHRDAILKAVAEDHPTKPEVELIRVNLQNQIEDTRKDLKRLEALPVRRGRVDH